MRNDLNQIPYDYTVEVMNRFNGLDLVDKCLKNNGWRFVTLHMRWWTKPSPRKRNEEDKVVVWGSFTNSWEKKRSKRQWKKDKTYPTDCRVQENSKDKKKAFQSEQCREIEEKNIIQKTRDLFKKIRDTEGKFHEKMGKIRTETQWT